jgi:hypothetical protein
MSCRLWVDEIQWIAEATPELAFTWTTQATSHGSRGYHSVLRIHAVYASSDPVVLNLTAFDGNSPAQIHLPGTGAAKHKLLVTLTSNKGLLYTYSATSVTPFQIFEREWICEISDWGRSKQARRYNLLGGAFDDKARI